MWISQSLSTAHSLLLALMNKPATACACPAGASDSCRGLKANNSHSRPPREGPAWADLPTCTRPSGPLADAAHCGLALRIRSRLAAAGAGRARRLPRTNSRRSTHKRDIPGPWRLGNWCGLGADKYRQSMPNCQMAALCVGCGALIGVKSARGTNKYRSRIMDERRIPPSRPL